MGGLFGSDSTSKDKLPSWLKNTAKTTLGDAKRLVRNDTYEPYGGKQVADKNQWYGKAARVMNNQRDRAGATFGNAIKNLNTMNEGASTYRDANKLIDQGTDSFQRHLSKGQGQLTQASRLGAGTRAAMGLYDDLPGIVQASQGRAEDLQLGVGNQVRSELSQGLESAGETYTDALGRTRDASELDGTNYDAIEARINPYAAMVKDLNIDDYLKSRSIGGARVADSARAAGAFGGSRHGVAQGMFDQETSKGTSDIITKSNYEGFMTAMDQLNKDRDAGLRAAQQLSGIQGARDTSTLGYTDALGRSSQADAGLIRQGGLDLAGATKDSAAGQMGAERQLYDMDTGLADRYLNFGTTSANQKTAAAQAKLAAQDQRHGQEISRSDALARLGQADQASRQALAADLLGYGKEVRGIRQQQLDAKKNAFEEEQKYPYEQLNWLTSIMGGIPYPKTTNTTQTDGIGNALIGGVSTLLGGFLSDEDEKENREPADGEDVLEKIRGMSIDDYNYRREPIEAGIAPEGRRTGPMAGEFAENFGGDGHTIDYAQAIGTLFAAVKELDARLGENGVWGVPEGEPEEEPYGGSKLKRFKRAA